MLDKYDFLQKLKRKLMVMSLAMIASGICMKELEASDKLPGKEEEKHIPHLDWKNLPEIIDPKLLEPHIILIDKELEQADIEVDKKFDKKKVSSPGVSETSLEQQGDTKLADTIQAERKRIRRIKLDSIKPLVVNSFYGGWEITADAHFIKLWTTDLKEKGCMIPKPWVSSVPRFSLNVTYNPPVKPEVSENLIKPEISQNFIPPERAMRIVPIPSYNFIFEYSGKTEDLTSCSLPDIKSIEQFEGLMGGKSREWRLVLEGQSSSMNVSKNRVKILTDLQSGQGACYSYEIKTVDPCLTYKYEVSPRYPLFVGYRPVATLYASRRVIKD